MSPYRMSKIERAPRLVLEFNQARNRHDVAAMVKLISDDCVLEPADPAPDGTVYTGKQAIAQYWHDFFRQSPDAHIEIEEIFGLGYRCIMRWRYEWLDESGQKAHIRGVDIFRIKNDLLCEQLSYDKG